MNKLQKCRRQLVRSLELFMAMGILAIAVIVVVQAILSSCFNASVTGANEVLTKLFVYVTSLGAAVAVDKNDHISIQVVTDLLPKRGQAIVHRLSLLFVAILNVTVVIYSVHWIRITGHYLMPTTQLPRIAAQLSIPVGCGLAAMFCLLKVIDGDGPNEGTAS